MANETAEAKRMAAGRAFEGIVGNAPALRVLSRALENGAPSHAYLFHGPEGVGKRAVALRFGAALVAGGDAGAEERAVRGLHPDVVEVEPEGQFTTIGQVREVVRGAASRPFEGARRFFLLRADTLNVQAANALLKTLEEPEGPSVFVLLARSREAVLPTILSRAQQVRFDPVPVEEVAAFLARRGHGEEEEARLAAALGRGSVGLALRYAEDGPLRGLRSAVFGAFEASLAGPFEERHRAAEEVLRRAEEVGAAREAAVLEAGADAEDGAGRGPGRRARDAAKRAGRAARDGAVAEALELLALVFRDAAVVAAGAEGLVASLDLLAEIRVRVGERPEADWAGAAREAVAARGSLAYNVPPEAILEAALSRSGRHITGAPSGKSSRAS